MSHHTTINRKFIPIASMLVVFAGAAMGATAQAADEPQYDKTVVTYGDLNLDSRQGTKMLYARLRNGAEDVCASFEGRDLFFRKMWQACFDHAVADAVAQINKPGLTSLHEQTISRSKG